MTSQNANPRVSVIVPAFNAARCIGRAIESVQAQSEQDFEIVVVDDASTDDTAAVVRALAEKDPRIVFHRLAVNGGPSVARNAAFAAARGRWLALLDDDDIFRPERLRTLCDLAEANDLDAIGDDLSYYDEMAGIDVGRANFIDGNGLIRVDMDDYLESTTYKVGPLQALYREDRLISLLQFVISRDFVVRNAINYSTKYRYCEDFLLYFDLFRSGARVGLYNKAMYVYTQKLGSVSRQSSPHSRTVPDRSSIADAVDEILADPRGLTNRQQELLALRRDSARSALKYETFRLRFKHGEKGAFFMLLLKNEDVWFRFLREVRYGVVARIRKAMFYRKK